MATKYTALQGLLINCTQMFGQVWFKWIKKDDIWPDESTSAFVWRKQYKKWIKFVNWLSRNSKHCEEAYNSEKLGLQNAPEYRAKEST